MGSPLICWMRKIAYEHATMISKKIAMRRSPILLKSTERTKSKESKVKTHPKISESLFMNIYYQIINVKIKSLTNI